MPRPDLSPGSYGLGDLAVGDSWSIGSAQITPALIDAFAAVTGDRFEIHMTDEGAARHGFKARVAHGLLVLSVVDGLKNQSPVHLRAVASLEWHWGFASPVLAGDTINARITVAATRATKRPDRGIAMLGFSVTNQDGVVVQSGQNQLMMLM